MKIFTIETFHGSDILIEAPDRNTLDGFLNLLSAWDNIAHIKCTDWYDGLPDVTLRCYF